mmetsp:Transcript_1028/g.3969  ORF Transcript_1028/g.3969 Transcript_1028/m.3969 type:complete len:224 (+) Transcript_1028:354-1025(+)
MSGFALLTFATRAVAEAEVHLACSSTGPATPCALHASRTSSGHCSSGVPSLTATETACTRARPLPTSRPPATRLVVAQSGEDSNTAHAASSQALALAAKAPPGRCATSTSTVVTSPRSQSARNSSSTRALSALSLYLSREAESFTVWPTYTSRAFALLRPSLMSLANLRPRRLSFSTEALPSSLREVDMRSTILSMSASDTPARAATASSRRTGWPFTRNVFA